MTRLFHNRNFYPIVLANLILLLSACGVPTASQTLESPTAKPLLTETIQATIPPLLTASVEPPVQLKPPPPTPPVPTLPQQADTRQPGTIFGASILPAIGPSGGLDILESAKFHWSRIDISWKNVESIPGELDWSRNSAVDEQLFNAAQAGFEVVVIVGDTPEWAVKPGFTCGVIREDMLDRFASFLTEAVARYSKSPYNIHYWEITNEPDVAGFLGCWGDPSDPKYFGGEAYGRMLSKIYPAIKSADPNAQVLVGGLLLDCDPIHPPDDPQNPGHKKDCTPARFFEGILESGARDAFDGVAFHSYDYYVDLGLYNNPNWGSDRRINGSSTIAKAAYLRSVLDAYHVTGRYLLNTEYAIFCGRDQSNDCDSFISKVETTKAYYVVQFAAAALADGYRAAIWYATQSGRNSSLLNPDLTPKPAFMAYQFTNAMIGGADFSRMIEGDTSFKIFEFRKNNQFIWVAWTMDGEKHTLNLTELPEAFYRILDNGLASSEPPSQQISLSLEPVFLVFK